MSLTKNVILALVLGSTVLLGSSGQSITAQAASARRKLIIDQDSFGPGGSNMQSILMALQSPDVDLLGITVESGDGWRDENVAHLLRLLELVGRPDVPVIPGASFPLVNSMEATRRWEGMYGALEYKGAWMAWGPAFNGANHTPYHEAHTVPPLREGAPTLKPSQELAASFLLRMVKLYPGQITVMALGPFTNLALAQSLDDHFAGLAKELVCASGSFNPTSEGPPGSVPNHPRSEFNNRWDPEAAHIMLHAGWRRVIVRPNDATAGTEMTDQMFKLLSSSSSKASRYITSYSDRTDPMWDEVAVAVWLKPSLISQSDQIAVDVDIDSGGPTYGDTLSWPAGAGPHLGEPDVTVITKIDIKAFQNLFVDLITNSRQ